MKGRFTSRNIHSGGQVREHVFDGKTDDKAHHSQARNKTGDIKANVRQRQDQNDDPEKDLDHLLEQDFQGPIVLHPIKEAPDILVCCPDDKVTRKEDDRDDQPPTIVGDHVAGDSC